MSDETTACNEANRVIAALRSERERLSQSAPEPRPIPPAHPLPLERLDAGVRLSESLLWRLQEEFFRGRGLGAWDVIPYYITNNTVIAASYAELIVACLLDLRPQLDAAEPVYVVEMAAGIACFGYYVVQELTARMLQHRCLRDIRVCYVITDFTPDNLTALAAQELFAPLLAAGKVDFAVFRPEDDDRIVLRHAGREVGPGSLRNPLIAIANYFFESIRQDL